MAGRSKRDVDREKKIHRLLSILRILDIRKQCTPKTLAQEFGTTERNIYRDINTLNAAGFSITYDKKEDQTYRFTDTDFSLSDLSLNKDELTALLIGKQLSHSLGEPFEKAFQSLLNKVHKDTGTKTAAISRNMDTGKRFFIGISPVEEFKHIERQFNAVNEAMDKKEEIEIVYKAMKNRQETKRV
ncbi:MAG: HTH domain-containing protein, partial [Nitrospira sp.]|nr:HTH domain-containing protein [Nitrospira sp.]